MLPVYLQKGESLTRKHVDSLTFPVYIQRLDPSVLSDAVWVIKADDGYTCSEFGNMEKQKFNNNVFLSQLLTNLQVMSIGIIHMQSDIIEDKRKTMDFVTIPKFIPSRVVFYLLDKDVNEVYEDRVKNLRDLGVNKQVGISYTLQKANLMLKALSEGQLRHVLSSNTNFANLISSSLSRNLITMIDKKSVALTSIDNVINLDSDHDENDTIPTSSTSLNVDRLIRFRGKTFLGTDEVDMYLEILSKNLSKRVTAIIPSGYWLYLTNQNKSLISDTKLYDWRKRKWFSNISKARMIFVPIVINSHWILGRIDFHTKEIGVYNSLPQYSYNKDLVTSNLQKLGSFVINGDNSILEDTRWNLVTDCGPTQSDSYNCGIYVLQRLRFATENMDNNIMQSKIGNADELRYKFMREIERNA